MDIPVDREIVRQARWAAGALVAVPAVLVLLGFVVLRLSEPRLAPGGTDLGRSPEGLLFGLVTLPALVGLVQVAFIFFTWLGLLSGARMRAEPPAPPAKLEIGVFHHETS